MDKKPKEKELAQKQFLEKLDPENVEMYRKHFPHIYKAILDGTGITEDDMVNLKKLNRDKSSA